MKVPLRIVVYCNVPVEESSEGYSLCVDGAEDVVITTMHKLAEVGALDNLGVSFFDIEFPPYDITSS